ncbi:MAG: hypothetical protein PHC97_04055 [Patescibacteria group bacterium]|nr:hypothetical protein [Patescibacteria group bacterium]
MAIDFLGKQGESGKRPKIREVELHIPEKEKLAPKAPVKEFVQKRPEISKVVQKEELPEADLSTSYRKSRGKKRLIFILIIVIIIGVIAVGTYYLFGFLQAMTNRPILANVNVNLAPIVNENVNAPVIVPQILYMCNLSNGQCAASQNGTFVSFIECQSTCFIPTPTPTPIPPPAAPPQPLSDTELAPLRGAIVRFSGETNLYLVENNGELRKIDIKTVKFKNGQTISGLNPKLIYTLAERLETTRKGKDVVGNVAWDPRVLSEEELDSFIK